jgi:N-acetylglucosaminyl-diphospho-decaprenol L-rhamnosyltransferase
MNEPLVACIIVNHDQPDAVAAQLDLLLGEGSNPKGALEVVVVQNGAARLAAERFPQARFVECPNRGYGSAVNLGVSHTRSKALLALNADLVLTPTFVDDLRRTAQMVLEWDEPRRRIGVVGGALFDSHDRRQGSFGPWPTLARLLLGLLRPRPVRRYWPTTARQRDVPWATGASFLFRRDCWEELGGFDEAFFMYYEDVDFCRRAWQEGWRVIFSPRPAATHFLPYHHRPLTVAMARMARRSTLVYFWKHRPRWEFHLLARIILLECWWRRHDPGWSSIADLVRRVVDNPREIPTGPP